LPKLGNESASSQVRGSTNFIYRGFLTPIVAYGGIVAIMRNRWKDHLEHVEKEKQSESPSEENHV
jgi:hypothetical protein